ncbi:MULTISPECIES: hypothetical protein [Acinetobacter]|uniref:hypothetical protein n=1 Tax=Acinetobacter TaxID=469 RepID=UPI0005374C94|nr:hypothetical protein [Acinetobacter sp. HR7]KGT46483.1 hypothetical protein GW12_25400 [Acinetobacter sp. HR7]
MLRTLHITIGIEYQQKELFEKALLDHNINFEMDGGHLPKKVSPYYKELDIIPCRYYLSGSKDWKDVINNPQNMNLYDEFSKPFYIFLLQNEFINNYLKQFYALEKFKDFFIPNGSHLLCSYDSYIQHEDVITFGSETINNLSRLGLGIDYNHACYD